MELIHPSFVPHRALTFPRASQILLIGPPGDVKSRLAVRYLCDRAVKGEIGLYATTVLTPTQVKQIAVSYGGESLDSLQVIDGVSCIRGKPSNEKHAFTSLSELNSVSRILLDALNEAKNGHLCIDSLSTLMIYSEPSSVIKFIRGIAAKAKVAGVSGIYVLEDGVHDERIVASLRFILDGVIQTKEIDTDEGLKHLLRLEYIRGTVCESRWLMLSSDDKFQSFFD